ncbi:hypothetical protein [Paraburkholderia sp. J12]|uniref:hypothetical protein n=1 Tax=Paraburkholderia sp. J12 TaxID=2805432 RepID=UPI002ABE39E5|nr:hypothetical protein [Paraburkholderia sp. J12]
MKEIDEIRRDNLRLIEVGCGSATATAKLLDMSLAQYINLRDGAPDSKSGKRRGMHKNTARRIEIAAGKPSGWLDADHASGESLAASTSDPMPTGWEKLDALGRAQVAAFIQGLLAQPNDAKNQEDEDRPLGD